MKDIQNNSSQGKKLIQFNKNHVRPLKVWVREISIRQECHRELANYYKTRDKIMNGITVTLSAFSSSAIFAKFSSNDVSADASAGAGSMLNYQLIGGIVAVSSTIMQSLHNALQLTELTEQHKIACKQFTKLKFRLQVIAGDNYEDDGSLNMDRLTDWTREYMDLLESSPMIHIKILEKHAGLYDSKEMIESEGFELVEDEDEKGNSDGSLVAVGVKEDSDEGSC